MLQENYTGAIFSQSFPIGNKSINLALDGKKTEYKIALE